MSKNKKRLTMIEPSNKFGRKPGSIFKKLEELSSSGYPISSFFYILLEDYLINNDIETIKKDIDNYQVFLPKTKNKRTQKTKIRASRNIQKKKSEKDAKLTEKSKYITERESKQKLKIKSPTSQEELLKNLSENENLNQNINSENNLENDVYSNEQSWISSVISKNSSLFNENE